MNRTPSSRPSPPVGEKVPDLSAVALAVAEGRLRGIPTGSWPRFASKFWRFSLPMKRPRLTIAVLLLITSGSLNLSAQILIATNSTWKFVKGTREASAPTNAWRTLAFDDSTWMSSAAPFYYDADPAPTYTGNTLLGDMRNTYTCIFMRKKFVAAGASNIATLNLRALCDDGFVAWINGTLVTNYNQTSGNYAYTNVASAGATEPLQWFGATLANPGSYLISGTNVLATQAFNRPI